MSQGGDDPFRPKVSVAHDGTPRRLGERVIPLTSPPLSEVLTPVPSLQGFE